MSAEVTNPMALRPLSKMEMYSSYRQHLGIYRCVIFTCRYTTSPSSSPATLYAALARVITKHPMLRVGILGQDTDNALFSHVLRVDLRNHVEFRTLDKAEGAEYNQALSDVQAWCHDQLFEEVESRPPWRIIVARPSAQSEFEDVVFRYHHSLMDGTSGKLFHEGLLAALNDVGDVSAEPQYVLDFLDSPALPEGQEDAVPFTVGAMFMVGTLWSNLAPRFLRPAKPTVWHGKPIDFSHPHKARVLAVDVPAEDVANLVAACRSHNTTVTALFHALILTSLARRLPASEAPAPAFVAATPINLRPWLSPSVDATLKDSLRVLVSNTTHHFPASVTGPLRDASGNELDALIWKAAQKIKADIRARTSTLPADDVVSLMKYISSWKNYFLEKDGQPREATWELSNVGSLNTTSSDPRRITRLLFTNGIMVAGAPMGFSMGTVDGGPLTIGLSWQEDIVPATLLEGIVADLAAFPKRLRETGKLFV
ncbi:hypothetical protein AURDEDRAFT_150454 [Auricularia subglabra TFB-10046 SS5]|nr:hypothetical protein AURDEDRAFT_150454 [Auricularia subglabra TFB-10046 SS5]